VLRRSRAGVWTRDQPGLPPALPVLSLGAQHALPIPVVREFLEGRPVEMGAGELAASPSEYYRLVKGRQQAWLDQALLGAAPDRASLVASTADDASTADLVLTAAESALLTASVRWGVALDFSRESLRGVEEILGTLHEALRAQDQPGDPRPGTDQVRRMAVVWGAYVGEVMRRHYGGRWSNAPVGDQGPVLRLEIGTAQVYPLRKVEKRILEGPGDAIPFYFQAVGKLLEGKLG
jgi:hypothetical protein